MKTLLFPKCAERNSDFQGPKIDEELQRQIEANGGLFEPLLVEPHPDLPGKFRIIDGDRRWTNSQVLVEQGKARHGVDRQAGGGRLNATFSIVETIDAVRLVRIA
jgi:hypothetical protein